MTISYHATMRWGGKHYRFKPIKVTAWKSSKARIVSQAPERGLFYIRGRWLVVLEASQCEVIRTRLKTFGLPRVTGKRV
jgi:hypothetical protein